MSVLYMLDTDIASYIIKRHSPEIEVKLVDIEPSRVCISAITCAELLYGLKRLPPEHRLHQGVRRFLKVVRVLAWDRDAAGFYADIRDRLVTAGEQIGELDMMIAAHSIAAMATLVTNNIRHYERISAPLILENWA
ncbi:MAG: PIN domain-containing protein [Bryobacterales bacterium]|nr:PIN domain-containing protein [Bryobacterales bacterium]MBV9399327.1 PIN domain-containing protein [Bryobacterales bacterium]